jgi:hypothetical protein
MCAEGYAPTAKPPALQPAVCWRRSRKGVAPSICVVRLDNDAEIVAKVYRNLCGCPGAADQRQPPPAGVDGDTGGRG